MGTCKIICPYDIMSILIYIFYQLSDRVEREFSGKEIVQTNFLKELHVTQLHALKEYKKVCKIFVVLHLVVCLI